MTVYEIIEKYLKENGYDGLYEPYSECDCKIGDLIPCFGHFGRCKPGYKVSDPSGEYDFLIVGNKEEQTK